MRNRLEIGQKIQGVRDLAQALRQQEGTFLAVQGTSSLIVVCEPGHSIKSVRAVGSATPAFVPLGYSGAWDIEKINNSTDVPSEIGAEQQQQQVNRQTGEYTNR